MSGLSAPRTFFGVHSFTPYNRSTGLFYNEMRVLDGSSLSMTGELVELVGGSSKFSWAAEDGAIKAELDLKFSEYPDFLFQLFLGKAVTNNSAETGGNVSTLTNKYGTSLMDASTGIASVSIVTASKTDLKFGKYVVQAASASTVDVFFSSDLDIARGTAGTYTTDTLKILAAASITTSADTTITNFGLKLTGGSGTIGMTTGDTATFMVRPVNTGSTTVTIGGAAAQSFPEFGALIYSQLRSNGEMLEIDCFRCKAVGAPIDFQRNAWSKGDVKCSVLYDSTNDGVFALRHVKTA